MKDERTDGTKEVNGEHCYRQTNEVTDQPKLKKEEIETNDIYF